MRYRVKLPPYAALPALVALAAAAYLTKPVEFRRDPLTEALGLLGLTPKYEAFYSRCADGNDAASLNFASLAKGFVGGYAHRFAAADDSDARAFARAARPHCALAALHRLERRWPRRSDSPALYHRVRVELSQS